MEQDIDERKAAEILHNSMNADQSCHYIFTVCANGYTALEALRTNSFNLLIVQDSDKDLCGDTLMRIVRNLGYSTPAVLLAAKVQAVDMLESTVLDELVGKAHGKVAVGDAKFDAALLLYSQQRGYASILLYPFTPTELDTCVKSAQDFHATSEREGTAVLSPLLEAPRPPPRQLMAAPPEPPTPVEVVVAPAPAVVQSAAAAATATAATAAAATTAAGDPVPAPGAETAAAADSKAEAAEGASGSADAGASVNTATSDNNANANANNFLEGNNSSSSSNKNDNDNVPQPVSRNVQSYKNEKQQQQVEPKFQPRALVTTAGFVDFASICKNLTTQFPKNQIVEDAAYMLTHTFNNTVSELRRRTGALTHENKCMRAETASMSKAYTVAILELQRKVTELDAKLAAAETATTLIMNIERTGEERVEEKGDEGESSASIPATAIATPMDIATDATAASEGVPALAPPSAAAPAPAIDLAPTKPAAPVKKKINAMTDLRRESHLSSMLGMINSIPVGSPETAIPTVKAAVEMYYNGCFGQKKIAENINKIAKVEEAMQDRYHDGIIDQETVVRIVVAQELLKNRYQEGYYEMQNILLDRLQQTENATKLNLMYTDDGKIAGFRVANQPLPTNLGSSSSVASGSSAGTQKVVNNAPNPYGKQYQSAEGDEASVADSFNSNTSSWRQEHNRKGAHGRQYFTGSQIAKRLPKRQQVRFDKALTYMILGEVNRIRSLLESEKPSDQLEAFLSLGNFDVKAPSLQQNAMLELLGGDMTDATTAKASEDFDQHILDEYSQGNIAASKLQTINKKLLASQSLKSVYPPEKEMPIKQKMTTAPVDQHSTQQQKLTRQAQYAHTPLPGMLADGCPAILPAQQQQLMQQATDSRKRSAGDGVAIVVGHVSNVNAINTSASPLKKKAKASPATKEKPKPAAKANKKRGQCV